MPTDIAAPEAAAHAVLVDSRGWVLIATLVQTPVAFPGGYVHIGE
jgi:hypothetical protein